MQALAYLEVSLTDVVDALTMEFAFADVLKALADGYGKLERPCANRVAKIIQKCASDVTRIEMSEEEEVLRGEGLVTK